MLSSPRPLPEGAREQCGCRVGTQPVCPHIPEPVPSTLFLQLCHSSPGAQSSCSSEPSPLGNAPNNDSGVEMPGAGPGSLGDLTALDDTAPGADAPALAAPSAGGLHLRKHVNSMHRFEQLKREKLKSLKDSCSWAGPAPHTRNTKLPPLPSSGEWRPGVCRRAGENLGLYQVGHFLAAHHKMALIAHCTQVRKQHQRGNSVGCESRARVNPWDSNALGLSPAPGRIPSPTKIRQAYSHCLPPSLVLHSFVKPHVGLMAKA